MPKGSACFAGQCLTESGTSFGGSRGKLGSPNVVNTIEDKFKNKKIEFGFGGKLGMKSCNVFLY